MPAPINYLAGLPDPFQGLTEALQLGQQIRAFREKSAQEEAARQQQEQYNADIQAAMQAPTPEAFASLALKYPKYREAFKQSWDQIDAGRQQTELKDATELASMLQAGRSDMALARLDDRIKKAGEAGQPTDKWQMLRDKIQADPQGAYGTVLHAISAVPGGDKLLENLGKLGTEQRAQAKAPAELRTANAGADKAEADAATARITAKYADQQAIVDLQKKGWDIQKIQADIQIAKEANRIAAMNAATNREGNSLKREELRLKVEEARSNLDSKIREKVATAESGAANIDNMLNTIERVKAAPGLDSVVGGLEGRLPAGLNPLSDKNSDAVALIDTLGSQAFLAQIPSIKGTGALSNAEGEKLQAALQSLSRVQSEKQFRANLDEAARLLKKGRENLSRSTGVPLAPPDTPAAPGARPPLSSFNR